jgi:hypothetical protein
MKVGPKNSSQRHLRSRTRPKLARTYNFGTLDHNIYCPCLNLLPDMKALGAEERVLVATLKVGEAQNKTWAVGLAEQTRRDG